MLFANVLDILTPTKSTYTVGFRKFMFEHFLQTLGLELLHAYISRDKCWIYYDYVWFNAPFDVFG